MDVQLTVPSGTDIAIVRREYSDLYLDIDEYGEATYFIGKSSDDVREKGEREWMTYNEAVEFCGFVDGAIPDAECMIEGNGGWAQDMISRKDFSGLAVDDKTKRYWKRRSNRYWRAHKRGQLAAKK